jgi:SAM-dependent methyltransferase
MRRTSFLYDDGVVLCATLRGLDQIGILSSSLSAELSISELLGTDDAPGYGRLRAGLRSLAGQGWISPELTLRPETTYLRWTERGREAARYFDRYVALGSYLSTFSSNDPGLWVRPWEGPPVEAFLELLEPCLQRWAVEPEPPEDVPASVVNHLDGALTVPAMVALEHRDALGEESPTLPDNEAGRGVASLLEVLGWVDADCHWTDRGRHARDYARHWGIVASYLPLFARLPDLYRGTASIPKSSEPGAPEWHVNRELNVHASAAAHGRYFSDCDQIFRELFDREPLSEQPRFIADVGTGDASWLVHLHQLITEETRRGQALDEYPLTMVGVDFNIEALDAARPLLEEAGVPAELVIGDVSDPDGIAAELEKKGLAMEDGLHIRSFLDHDRNFAGGDSRIPVKGLSTGAYVDRSGAPLDAADVEEDLVVHLRRWAPHARKHGMVVVEAHCVAPEVASKHLGALHSVAFDAYHAYSCQYPIEYSSFVSCCRLAGLERVSNREKHYPSSRPFVAVSINRLLARSQTAELPAVDAAAPEDRGWKPDPGTDLDDGRALHELLFAGGDLAYPRPWCGPATGFVVGGALEVIEQRLSSASEGDVIRVLDYGCGSGLAAIELLKSSRNRDFEARLAERGATLEIHLADLPSSWFAQGYELLKDCSWTRFHSLRGSDGGFAPLLEVTGGLTMDAVMANMVFHLIPPAALEQVAGELASVLVPGGRLLWSAPDLGPPSRYASLFHDPNRALRKRWLDLLDAESAATSVASANRDSGSPQAASLLEALTTVKANLSASDLIEAQQRAERRILPQAHDALDVVAALHNSFDGELQLRTYEMLDEEILEALLVPSNAGEYLSEITNRALREHVVQELMLNDILPSFRAGPASTGRGLNVQWSLGDFPVRSAT